MTTFSVLIPTKNRPEVLENAIRSVLSQTFTDLEVIVSINDDEPALSQAVAAKFLADGRFRYYCTDGTLSMPANWEHALSYARGDYVTVLEDKMVLYPDALRWIAAHLEGFRRPEAAMWRYDTWQDGNTLIKMWGNDKSEMVPSEHLLGTFVQHGFDFGIALRQNCNTMLPRMINSCVKRETVNKILQTSPAFFQPINPDFTSAFQQLLHVKDVLFIDHSFSIWGPASKSNARNIRSRTEGHVFFDDIARESKGLTDFLRTPIKSLRLINNLEYGDYLRLMPEGPRLTPGSYAFMALLDIVRTYKRRAIKSEEFQDWLDYMNKELPGEFLGKFIKAGFTLPLRGALYKMVRPIPYQKAQPRPGHWSLLSGFGSSLEASRALPCA